MAQLHFLTIETKALLTRPNKGIPYNEGWIGELQQYGLTLYFSDNVELIEKTQEKQTVKTSVDISTSVTVSDEEYKAWRHVDWVDEFEEDDTTVNVLYKECFVVLDDNSEWVEDEEEEFDP